MPRSSFAPFAAVLLHLPAGVSLVLSANAEEADESTLTESQRAELYVSQLADLECVTIWTTEEIYVDPYLTRIEGKLSERTPARKLRELGMAAVPALVQALDDDTPTKTVKQFGGDRHRWRVCDFAWVILKGTLKRDFTEGRLVRRDPYSMSDEERRQVYQRIKDWYEENKGLSQDELMLTYFSSPNPGDWFAAGEYFLRNGDERAVEPLLQRIVAANSRTKGYLCRLVARFEDPRAMKVVRQVLETADEPSDRLNAAFALGRLGDASGVPTVVEYLTQREDRFHARGEAVSFLMRARTKEGIEALRTIVATADPDDAEETLLAIDYSLTGSLAKGVRTSSGSAEIAAVLMAAMNRDEYTRSNVNGVRLRIKDHAARAFLLLKDGTTDALHGEEPTDCLFNPKALLPEIQRDFQIERLKAWYKKHKDNLSWNAERKRLVVKSD